jgi:pyridoxamine 5'-phosphate oxidase
VELLSVLNSTRPEDEVTDTETLDRLPETLPDDPMHWADGWLKEAIAGDIQRNPNAMTIVSVGEDDQPSARVVLCKAFVPDPGYLVFYTNYQSRKARELENNPKAAALFHWDALGRQVRIEGLVVRSPDDESDAYFASRGWGSQLGAWGSDQSRPIASKQALVDQIRARGRELGLSLEDGTQTLAQPDPPAISRPPHWGGLRLWATRLELWIEGADRIHDRGVWTRNIVRGKDHQFTVTPWSGGRLQP